MTHEAFTDTSRLVDARVKNLKQEVATTSSNSVSQSNSPNSKVQSGQGTGPKKVLVK